MSFKVGILGGGLQGTEAACLAQWAGWESRLVDLRPQAPASGLADVFLTAEMDNLKSLDKTFKGCDLVVPACENIATLELLSQWSQASSFPVAFDLGSYRLTCDKNCSKELFVQAQVPTFKPYPEATYPLIAKPVSGSGSRGVTLLQNEADFKAHFHDGNIEGWVVEEYCPGPSYSLEITGQPGNYRSWLTTVLEMDEVYDCRQVWSPADISEAEEEQLKGITHKLAEALQLRGLMDVEVILNPQQGFKVLEIDARLPSQTPTVVWWSCGENLLYRLGEIFTKLPPAPAAPPAAAVIYEHACINLGQITLAGEHIMSNAGSLCLHENFYGADWAVTNYRPGLSQWVATLIFIDHNLETVRGRREETFNRLKSL